MEAENRSGAKRKIILVIVLVLCLATALTVGLVLHFKYPAPEKSEPETETGSPRTEALVDCHPDVGANQSSCEKRGCKWQKSEEDSAPWCTYTDAVGYEVVSGTTTLLPSGGKRVQLIRKGPAKVYGMDTHERITVDIDFYTNDGLNIKFYPNGSSPYEVPKSALNMSTGRSAVDNPQYRVNITEQPYFGIKVIRNSTGTVVFDTVLPGLIFSEQYLQLSTKLSSDSVYGFGEHNHRRYKHNMTWKTWPIFTRDVGPIDEWNLYGAQPVYLNLEKDGKANVVFLKNSNAMEVSLQPSPHPAITYRVIGGVLDFYIFMGPTPGEAVQQYTKAVGTPMMPPYWTLGFQLCRWHYGNLSVVKETVRRQQEAGIPQDVQWLDIDSMYEKLIFTYDRTQYNGLPEFIKELHENGQKYVVIVDPGIGNEPSKTRGAAANSPGFNMYEDGLNPNVYVTNTSGDVLLAKVWPGRVGFPDFTNEAQTLPWWIKWIRYYRENESVPVDGLWIDMNEVASFVPGSVDGCEDNNWNYPPYMPNVLDRDRPYTKTICLDSQTYWGKQYDTHNLYGHSMAILTYKALLQVIPNKRPFVMTRSNFAGTSKWAAHWLGDNQSHWSNMAWSIIGILEYSIFGFPLVGADICGFWYNAQFEMCLRWQQLGAFYPFSRNHNGHNDPGKPEFREQDPAAWNSTLVSAARDALLIRYKLLPYLYTLMHRAHADGLTVARSLMFEFPTDLVAIAIDKQFLWGGGLMITPVLEEGKREVDAYIPDAKWYDYHTGDELKIRKDWTTLDAPLEKINLHVRGGHILPWQVPANTTHYSREKPMGLLVALDDDQLAQGELFWDDGETLDTYEKDAYIKLKFSVERAGKLKIDVVHNGYPDASTLVIDYLEFYGLGRLPLNVIVDGKRALDDTQIRSINNIVQFVDTNLTLHESHTVEWL